MAQDKFGVKEVMNVTFYALENDNAQNIVKGQPILYIDTLKLSNLENTAEESLARGGWGNPILITWDYNREANFAVQDALISFDGLALMTGNPIETEPEVVYKRESLKVTSGAATLSQTPVDPNTGLASDDYVFIYSAADGIGGGKIGSVSGTAITGLTTIDDGEEVVAYYPYKNSGSDIQVVTISSDNFPGTYKLVGDTFIRNFATGEDEPFQLVVEKVKVQPGFSLTMQAEGDPSVFDMNLKSLKPDDGTTMIKMIKYTDPS
jgi:hypothetical protein